MVKSQAYKKSIIIKYNDCFNSEILGSKDKFHQLAVNLIENALNILMKMELLKLI